MVRLIGQYNQTFVLLSGGHDFECASTSTGAVINLRRLNRLSIDKKNLRYTVGPGVVSKHILDALLDTGLKAVVGGCPTVGAIGWALGGGHSDQTGNIFGLGSTNTLEAKVILSDGRLITATRDNEHKDLLWAMMGAGGGKFGVVVELTSRLHRMKPLDYRDVLYDFGPDLLKFREFTTDALAVKDTLPEDSTFHFGRYTPGIHFMKVLCVDCGLGYFF